MTSKPKTGPQDLPPAGGYSKIQYQRIYPRRILSPLMTFGFTIGSFAVGFASFADSYKHGRRDEVEIRSAQLALTPLLWAERDRALIKQVIKNRDEEATLMQHYPGWEVGTYFGEPIYHWAKPEQFIEPIPDEYYAHTHPYEAGEKLIRCQMM